MKVSLEKITAIPRPVAKVGQDIGYRSSLRTAYANLTNISCGSLASQYYTDDEINMFIGDAVDIGRKLEISNEQIEKDINAALLIRTKRQYNQLIDPFNGYLSSPFEKDEKIEALKQEATLLGNQAGFSDDQITADIQKALSRGYERMYKLVVDTRIGSLSSREVKPDEIQTLKFKAHEIGKKLKHLPETIEQDIAAALEISRSRKAASA